MRRIHMQNIHRSGRDTPLSAIAALPLSLLALAGCESGHPADADAAVPPDSHCASQSPAPQCPPAAPYGYEVGDRLTNIDVTTCDGQPIDLHSLCGARVGLAVNVYTWCPGCIDDAKLATELLDEYEATGLALFIVISEDAYGDPADAEHCKELRDFYGFGGTVVFDPLGQMAAYGTSDTVVISDPAGTILFKRRGAPEHVIRAEVENALAACPED